MNILDKIVERKIVEVNQLKNSESYTSLEKSEYFGMIMVINTKLNITEMENFKAHLLYGMRMGKRCMRIFMITGKKMGYLPPGMRVVK